MAVTDLLLAWAAGPGRHFRLGAGHGLPSASNSSTVSFAGRRGLIAVVVDLGAHLQRRVLVLRIQVGLDEEVADVYLRRAPEGDVAEDAAETPHVLVFQVAAGAVAIDLDGHQVLARLHVLGDVELGGVAAVDAVADLLAVDPEEEGGIDAVEGDERCGGPSSSAGTSNSRR